MVAIQIFGCEKLIDNKLEVEIVLDSEGLESLLRQLEFLKRGSTHTHLMTPGWGGEELDEQTFGEGAQTINHLKIIKLDSDLQTRQQENPAN